MNKQLIIGGAITVLAVSVAAGADSLSAYQMNGNQQVSYDQSSSGLLYHDNELSIDAFGSDAISRYTIDHPSGDRIRHDSRLGAGLGVNYFFIRYVGIGGDAWSENAGQHFVDNASGNLILRLPFEPLGLAPYIFGGGGHQFDPSVATFGQAGGGLEWRFTHHLGIFADGRYIWTDRVRNYGLARAGLRFSF